MPAVLEKSAAKSTVFRDSHFNRLAAWILLALLSGLVLAVCIPDSWPLTVAQAGISGLAIAVLIRIATRRENFVWDWVLIPLLLMPLWAWAQLVSGTTVSRFDTLSRVVLYVTYACAYFVAVQTLRSRQTQVLFQTGCIYFGFLLAIEAILQRFTSGGKIFWFLQTDFTYNAFGPFVNHDHFSVLMELLLPLPLWRSVSDPKHSLRYLVVSATIFASIVMAASRAGFPLAAAELLLFLAIAIKRRGTSVGQIAAVAVFLIFASIVGWDYLWFRYTGQPYQERMFFYQGGLGMIAEKPFTGFGLGSWWAAYPSHAVYDANALLTHAHNDWLEWTAEAGIPFLGVMLTLAIGMLIKIPSSPWLMGVAAVFLHSLFDFGLQEPAIFLFLIAIGAAA